MLVADFNLDGLPDILFACHTKEGNHRTDSFLYWGNPSGYSPLHRSLIPSLGTHLFTATDIGNIYDRGERYDYISTAFDAGRDVRCEMLTWEGETPFATRLEFQVRVARTRDLLEQSEWLGPGGRGTFYSSKRSVLTDALLKGRWIQFKATLTSPNGANSPILRSVSLRFGPVK